jgi:hypothetical protein
LTYARKHWSRWQFRLLGGIVRLDAWARKVWASWNSDERGRLLYDELGRFACHMTRDHRNWVRRRLNRLAARQHFYGESSTGDQSEPEATAKTV